MHRANHINQYSKAMRLAGILAVLSSYLASNPVLAQATQYAVIRMESREEQSSAIAINMSSQMVGALTGYPFIEPCVWERGRYRRIGETGGYDAGAFDLNDLGAVVGFYEQADWREVPFVWTREAHEALPLPYLDGYDHARAESVNNLGTVVGFNTIYGQHGIIQAVRWDDYVPSTLPLLDGGCCAEATSINQEGWIVGWATDDKLATWPVLWEPGNAITPLGTFWPYGSYGKATGINDVGEIAGWSQARGGYHAFFWQDGEMVDVHDLYLGWDDSFGQAINNQSEIVGVLSNAIYVDTAFIWSPERGMEELVTYLPPSTRWTNLDTAWDINDLGRIVGWGSRDDTTPWEHGYLMTPVYPTFTLDQPSPGIAGEVNTITARNLAPGTRVSFAYSTAGGGAIIPKCKIIEAALQIEEPMVAGVAIANANGVARLTGKVPGKWSGQEVLIQALVPSECDISNLIVVAFE